MNEKEFKKLVKKDKYQVFLFSCPIPIPFNFAKHYWFITNRNGKLKRWEVLHADYIVRTPQDIYTRNYATKKRLKIISKNKGHIYQDILPFTKGMNKYYWKGRPLVDGDLLKIIEGKEDSLAKRMVDFIEKNSFKYKYWKTYRMIKGPNSNTFIQWIIDKFPSSGFKLSWRAIGKNYKPQE
jgi:hypothetical protein